MMKKQFLPNLVLSLTLSFAVVWIGSYITRLVLVYQFFEPVNLELRNLYNTQNLASVLTMVISPIVCNIITFPLFLVSFFLYIFISKINIKNEGWLFLTMMVIIITAPFEIYLLSMDLSIIELLFSPNYDVNQAINMIRERMVVLSSFPLIEIFCYIALVFVVVFKPLRKNEN
jgi:hypothetical protein